MGSLIKNFYAERNQLRPADIYHITLMPCYDKKLEASRGDFYNSDYNAKDVDCVLTAGKEIICLCSSSRSSLI